MTIVITLAACVSGHQELPDAFDQRELLRNAEETLENLLARNDEKMIFKLMPHARALVIFPDLVKASVIAGGRYGQGIVSIRSEETGKWGRPAFVKSLQASWGLQAGIQRAELVLIVVSRKGVKALYQTQYNLGVSPTVALGPIGKSLGISLQKLLNAKDIYAYSIVKGMFAGVSWEGTIVTEDEESNETFYRRPISHKALLRSSNV